MSYEWLDNERYSLADLNQIGALERDFFGREKTAEEVEDLMAFLRMGGRILVQKEGDEVLGCIEVIKVHGILSCDPAAMPQQLEKVFEAGVFDDLEADTIYLHGWISRPPEGKWLWRRLRHEYPGSELVGLVSSARLDRFLRRSAVCGIYRDLYGPGTGERYLLRLRRQSSLSEYSPSCEQRLQPV